MRHVGEVLSSMVFDDATMEARLPKETYRALKKSVSEGTPIDGAVAAVVANAM